MLQVLQISPYDSTPKQLSSQTHFQYIQNYSQHHHQWDQQGPAELVYHNPLDLQIQWLQNFLLPVSILQAYSHS